MKTDLTIPAKLAEQIEHKLMNLRSLTQAQCVLLADSSGQLINIQGKTPDVDPVLLAALGAADVIATTELVRLIGGKESGGALFRAGRHMNIYLFDIAGRFILIVIFGTGTLAGLVRTFGLRAAERLHKLIVRFENQANQPNPASSADFGDILAKEMDKAFEGL